MNFSGLRDRVRYVRDEFNSESIVENEAMRPTSLASLEILGSLVVGSPFGCT